MPRRAKGEGSIYHRKDGRWSGTYKVNGKAYVVYGKTQREAPNKLAEARRQRDAGIPQPDRRITVNALFREWLAYKQNTIKEITLRNYEQRIRVNVLPIIGRRTAASLTPRDLSAMYDEILRSGKTARTVAHVHRVLHGMLKDGERLGFLTRNVASLVTPPQPGPTDWTVLTRDQLRLFLAKSADTTYGALWALLASTGMRIGEALALQWGNFDFTAGTARIENTLSWRRGSWYLGDPKTYSSVRTVAVRQSVAEALKAWAVVQSEWKEICPEWATEGFVFTNGWGRPLYSTNLLRNHFRPIVRDAGLPEKMNIHDLRHTFATIALLQGGTPAEVADAHGHSSAATTLNIYAHALPGASGRMGDLVVGE